MGMIDIVVLLTLLISGIFALYRGLVRELLGLTAWVLAALGALYGLAFVRPFFRKIISNATIADIVGAGVLALVILVICTLVNAYVTSKLRKSALSGLDRLLGFFFGLLRGALLIVVVYFGASMLMSKTEMQKYEEKNFTVPFIQKGTEGLEKILPTSVVETLKQIESADETKTLKDVIDQEAEKKQEEEASYDDKEREDLNALILEKISD